MASVDPSKMALAYSSGVNSPPGGNTPVFSSQASNSTPSDSFESDNVKRENSEEDRKPKGKVPRWVISTMAWTLPVIASVGSRRFLPEAWSDTAKVAGSMAAGGITASGLEYWRQKNNDGKIKWGNWALNSLFGFVPFDFVLTKIGLAKTEAISQRRIVN